MKKLIFILSLLLLLPGVVFAAFNSVTVEGNVDILLPGNGFTYTLKKSTRVESFLVNTNDIEFTMKSNSIVEIESTNLSKFNLSSGCETLAKSCTATLSSITVQCSSDVTLTITPSGTCSGSSGGSSGGGGESTGTIEKTSTLPYFTLTLSVDKSFKVTFPSSVHTVTVTRATEDTADITIASDPINIILTKDESRDLDTDGDGVNDLRVTYLGLDGSGRPKVTVTELTASDSVAEVVEDVSSDTCLLKEREAFKHANSAAVYYVTKDCEKRAFNNSIVFFTYFNSWSDVNTVSKTTLDSLTDDTLGFMPWGPKYDPKYGALVKVVTDPKVYLLLGTERYWITDEDVFETLGYAWNWIEDIDAELLDKYTIGSEIDYTDRHPNFTLVKYADDPKVYKLEDSKKRHIKDEAAFEALNYRWDRIVTIADTEEYEDGDQLTAQ